jgi:hypothetical protein
MIILNQVEVAKDLITTTDATIIGILLAIISILLYWVFRQDKQLQELHASIKVESKEYLKMLLDLTNALKDKYEVDKEMGSTVSETKNITQDTNSTLKTLSNVIQIKLLKMD